jgi:hypothetical protein
MLGGAAITPAAVGMLYNPTTPIPFINGLQIIVATGGEYDVEWD